MKHQETKLLIPVMDFAFRKLVYATSVYSAIEKGKIKPDYVGAQKVVMIDIRKYGNYKFGVHNPNKAALIRWYVSVGYPIRGEKLKRRLMSRYGLLRHELTKQEPEKNGKYAPPKTLNSFTDWCYNRVVQYSKEGMSIEANIYYEILQKHFLWNLRPKQFVKQRAKAKDLLQRVSNALGTDTLNTLVYVGAERTK